MGRADWKITLTAAAGVVAALAGAATPNYAYALAECTDDEYVEAQVWDLELNRVEVVDDEGAEVPQVEVQRWQSPATIEYRYNSPDGIYGGQRYYLLTPGSDFSVEGS